MKIAIVGCGAVGSFYGAKLFQAGFDVNFLLRSDYNAVKQNGIYIQSVDGDFHIYPPVANEPQKIGAVDLVIIGLKTTANFRFKELLQPLVNDKTLILTLQNGLGNEEQLASIFGEENILGGLCFVCLNRISPGIIKHIAHGRIVMGEFKRKPIKRTYSIAEMLIKSGIQCEITENLEKAHWEKLVWNIPFNGLGVAGVAGYEAVESGVFNPDKQPGKVLTTDIILSDSRWENILRQLMREVILIANAKGLGVDPAIEEEFINRTRFMGAYKASTLLDFEMNRPLEIQSMYLEPLRQAEKAGVKVPMLKNLCNILVELDKLRDKTDS
ncbi:MAG: 2-dehydropantoate 2-reductase [Verrucomicrobiae bacterium]|nr:2-dehydropantoate 2-reductase [Verrucomicrobiae bacterium]